MAKQGQQAIRPIAEATRPEAGEVGTPGLDEARNYQQVVVFYIDKGLFGFRLEDVAEIIRVPNLASMPLAPRSLLGLANLRGVVLPVVSLRRFLGFSDPPFEEATRVIVINREAPVGLVVDRIKNLATLPIDRIDNNESGADITNPGSLMGVVKGEEGEETIRILNPEQLLRDEFARAGASAGRPAKRVSISSGPATTEGEVQQQVSLVSFDLGHQEYALPLEQVREIIPLPVQVAEVARAETAVLGVVTLRDRLLPLVSLRALLGLPSDAQREERSKVVVLSLGGSTVGMVADRTREILRVTPSLIDPAPALLTRGAGDAEITAICRLDHGKRLVAVLSPERLFRSELTRRVLSGSNDERDAWDSQQSGSEMAEEQFIIFRLGEQEYGLAIGAVDEVACLPDHITRLPKAPAFIEGVMNLRGSVVPIVDLRRRFDLPPREPGSAQRVLILAVAGGKTGFMVDGVSEIIKVPVDAIRPTPELSAEQIRLIGRVVNLDEQGRMILLVDVAHLLDQVEADVLAKLDHTHLGQAPKTS
jgi:purine-binding chemotaxis protein CheW